MRAQLSALSLYNPSTGASNEGTGELTRPVRVALVHFTSATDERNSCTLLDARFGMLGIDTFVRASGDDPEFKVNKYDVVAVTGSPALPDLANIRYLCEDQSNTTTTTTTMVLAFVPALSSSGLRINLLQYVDSIVCCGSNSKDGLHGVVYRFFESLVVPSLLNIDISDVRNIARGVGFSFYLGAADPDDMIARLPKICAFARSALLHFSCGRDVTLSEVYRVTRAIASKPQMNAERMVELSHGNAKKYFRRMNVKLGLRIGSDVENRMNLTAILFGL